MIDTKITSWEQIKRAADKAAPITVALSRVMPNIRGPRTSYRRLLMAEAQSIMSHRAEIWTDVFGADEPRKRMTVVQRKGVVRVASSYRMVLEPAVLGVIG